MVQFKTWYYRKFSWSMDQSSK